MKKILLGFLILLPFLGYSQDGSVKQIQVNGLIDSLAKKANKAYADSSASFYRGAYNVLYLGVKNDSITDNSALIDTLLAHYDNLYFPNGYYKANIIVNGNNKNLIFQSSNYANSKTTGAVIVGGISIYGNGNTIDGAGIYATSGVAGILVSTNASDNTIKDCQIAVNNHGILIEQYGGTAQRNKVINTITHGGIHGFVSKSQDAEFINCKSYGASTDGFAMVSDNITGLGLNSQNKNNRLLNCVAKSTVIGVSIYSRDYTSTTNTAGILFTNLSIESCLFDSCSAYGILVGDDGTAPGGQTYNNVQKVSIINNSISNCTTSGVKVANSTDCIIMGNNLKQSVGITKSGNAAQLKTPFNNFGGGSGNTTPTKVLTVNSTTPSVQNGENYFKTANTSSTVISNLNNGYAGQVITVMIQDSFTTIPVTTGIGVQKYVRGIGSVCILRSRDDLSGWDEVYSYSVNVNQDWAYQSLYVFDLNYGTYVTTQVTGNVSQLNFNNVKKLTPEFTLQLYSTSNYTLSGWDSRIVWMNGGAPTSTLANTRQIYKFFYDGVNLINTYRSDLLGANLSLGATTDSTRIIANSAGTGVTLPPANSISAGLLSATNKKNIDSLILRGYAPNTGVITGGTLSINAITSKFDISSANLVFADYSNILSPVTKKLAYAGATAITVTNIATQPATYVGIDTAGNIVQSATFFTNTQRRYIAELGAVIHSNNTIINAINNFPATLKAPISQLQDLMVGIGAFNVRGNKYSANLSTNLKLNRSAGSLFKMGANFSNSSDDPNVIPTTGVTALTFRYRTQNSTEGIDTAVLDPIHYDVGGTVTTIPNGSQWSIQRIVLFQSGITRILYGQAFYTSSDAAIAAIGTENFTVEQNALDNGLIRGYIVIRRNMTDLSNAFIIEAPKFGNSSAGSTGSVATLQSAYDNSIVPNILTNSTLRALSIKRGSGADTDSILTISNGGGTVTASINGAGDGNFSGKLTSTGLYQQTGFQPSSITWGATGGIYVTSSYPTLGATPLIGGKITDNSNHGDLINLSSQASGNIFKVDYSAGLNANTITSNNFIKIGGTSAQILMADGSVSTLTGTAANTIITPTVSMSGATAHDGTASGSSDIAIVKYGNVINFQGYLINITTAFDDIILTLPVGYRPNVDRYFLVANGAGTNTPARIRVSADGTVRINYASDSSSLDLTSIMYIIQ